MIVFSFRRIFFNCQAQEQAKLISNWRMFSAALLILLTLGFANDVWASDGRVFGVELGGYCEITVEKPITNAAGGKLVNFDCEKPKPQTDQFFHSVEIDVTPISNTIWQVVARSKFLEKEACEETSRILEKRVAAKRNAHFPCPIWGFGYKAGKMCFHIFCAPNLDPNKQQIQAEFFHNEIYPEQWKAEVIEYYREVKEEHERKAIDGIDLDKF